MIKQFVSAKEKTLSGCVNVTHVNVLRKHITTQWVFASFAPQDLLSMISRRSVNATLIIQFGILSKTIANANQMHIIIQRTALFAKVAQYQMPIKADVSALVKTCFGMMKKTNVNASHHHLMNQTHA